MRHVGALPTPASSAHRPGTSLMAGPRRLRPFGPEERLEEGAEVRPRRRAVPPSTCRVWPVTHVESGGRRRTSPHRRSPPPCRPGRWASADRVVVEHRAAGGDRPISSVSTIPGAMAFTRTLDPARRRPWPRAARCPPWPGRRRRTTGASSEPAIDEMAMNEAAAAPHHDGAACFIVREVPVGFGSTVWRQGPVSIRAPAPVIEAPAEAGRCRAAGRLARLRHRRRPPGPRPVTSVEIDATVTPSAATAWISATAAAGAPRCARRW